MRILLDTNIILDVLLKREPFFTNAQKILSAAEYDEIDECVSASAITDIYYIANRSLKDKTATGNLIKNLLTVVNVLPVTVAEIENALDLPWSDFEDAVQYSVALFNDIDGIITRDKSGYNLAELPIWNVEDFCRFLDDKNFDGKRKRKDAPRPSFFCGEI